MLEPLDYFSPHEPERRRARGVAAWSIVLLGSWLPYLCGIVNASTVARSYVPEVTAAHLHASILFLGLGLALSVLSLARFIHLRHLPGSIAAGVVVLMQGIVALCLGIAGT
jgi:hypothetical protein